MTEPSDAAKAIVTYYTRFGVISPGLAASSWKNSDPIRLATDVNDLDPDAYAALVLARNANPPRTAYDDEMDRLRDQADPPPWDHEPAYTFTPAEPFAYDADEAPAAIWGDSEQVLWATGEPLLIVGLTGVGKSTLALQLVDGLIHPGVDLLGLPISPTDGNVLYLAMDRPHQIARAYRRLWTRPTLEAVGNRLLVHKGPLPGMLTERPDLVLELALAAKATAVVIDSMKDLTDVEAKGSGYTINTALQHLSAEGVDVIGLHHQRKAGTDNKKPNSISDVYGSMQITAGAGSVICLWGQPGEPVVELIHLKQPASVVGPLVVTHDHDTGRSTATQAFDLYSFLRNRGEMGASAQEAAIAQTGKAKITRLDKERARSKLKRMVNKGLAHVNETDRGPVYKYGPGWSDPVDNPVDNRATFRATQDLSTGATQTRNAGATGVQRLSNGVASPSSEGGATIPPSVKRGESVAPTDGATDIDPDEYL